MFLIFLGLILFLAPSALLASYSDVSEQHESFRAIEYMRIKNIMTGDSGGTFRPDAPVNRAELMKILMLARGNLGGYEPFKNNCFPDVIDQWFASYVCSAKSLGWISGYPDGTFKPEKAVNFVEVLKMIAQTRFELTHSGLIFDPRKYFSQKEYQLHWYDTYLNDALYSSRIISQQVFDRDGQAIDGPVPRKRIAEILYRSFLTEGGVRWPIDLSRCSTDDLISAVTRDFVAATSPNARESLGLQLYVTTPEGECLLSEDINPYGRISKDFGPRIINFLVYTDDPEDEQWFSRSAFLKEKRAYLLDYLSDYNRNNQVWELDLEAGELRQVGKQIYLSTPPSAIQITKDYGMLLFANQETLYALDLRSRTVIVDEVQPPYLLHLELTQHPTDVVIISLPGRVRVTEDDVHYTVYFYRAQEEMFTGPFFVHEERSKKLSDIASMFQQ